MSLDADPDLLTADVPTLLSTVDSLRSELRSARKRIETRDKKLAAQQKRLEELEDATARLRAKFGRKEVACMRWKSTAERYRGKVGECMALAESLHITGSDYARKAEERREKHADAIARLKTAESLTKKIMSMVRSTGTQEQQQELTQLVKLVYSQHQKRTGSSDSVLNKSTEFDFDVTPIGVKYRRLSALLVEQKQAVDEIGEDVESLRSRVSVADDSASGASDAEDVADGGMSPPRPLVRASSFLAPMRSPRVGGFSSPRRFVDSIVSPRRFADSVVSPRRYSHAEAIGPRRHHSRASVSPCTVDGVPIPGPYFRHASADADVVGYRRRRGTIGEVVDAHMDALGADGAGEGGGGGGGGGGAQPGQAMGFLDFLSQPLRETYAPVDLDAANAPSAFSMPERADFLDPDRMTFHSLEPMTIASIARNARFELDHRNTEALLASKGLEPHAVASGCDAVQLELLKHNPDASLIVTELSTKNHGYRLDPCFKNAYGQTLLHMVCSARSCPQRLVADLIGIGFGVEERDVFGLSPLHTAVVCGRSDTVKALSKKGRASLNSPWSYDMTPLHIACMFGHTFTVKTLLSLNALTDIQDEAGCTPLMHAVFHGHRELVKILLAKNASVLSTQDKDGNNALIIALMRDRIDIANLLLDCAGAAAQVNVTNRFGMSPLWIALEAKQTGMVTKMCRTKGVDVNLRHGVHKNPLLHMCLLFLPPMTATSSVRLLLRSGADPDAVNVSRKTALFVAVACNSIEVIEELLGAGATVTASDRAHNLPLHFANSVAVCEMLMSRGSKMTAHNDVGNTPLHIMYAIGNQDLITWFETKGANTQVRNAAGEVPSDCAAYANVMFLMPFFAEDRDCEAGGGILMLQ